VNDNHPAPGGETPDGRPSADQVRRFLAERVAAMARIPADRVDVRAPIASFGIDSVHAIELVGDTEDWLGVPLPDDLPWSHPTIELIAEELGA
jgi:acyl carrier protein